VEVVATFDQMNFKEDLIRGIYGYGTQQAPWVFFLFCLSFGAHSFLIINVDSAPIRFDLVVFFWN
jgi:hypothetical protein